MKIKRMIKFLCGGCTAFAVALFSLALYYQLALPERFHVLKGENLQLTSALPLSASRVPQQEISTKTDVHQQYQVNISLFGLFPLKRAQVETVEENMLIPGGEPFGMKMFTQGAMVIGLTDIPTENGLKSPGKEADIHKGDIIISINGEKATSNEDIAHIVEKSGGEKLTICFTREGKDIQQEVYPVKNTGDGKYKLGIWVRDSSAGIGTITFYNPRKNSFAGLGHPVCDVDTGELMPLASGEIVKVKIDSVKKGSRGEPGELRGHFSSLTNLGDLEINSTAGVYGKLLTTMPDKDAMPLALKQEVKKGKATILTTIEGSTPQSFDIEIEKINLSSQNETKNMIIKVTDAELIEKTGGIVQGMSGSPIIQNGKIVGAVTHVFVNDPLKGYAIFAETMKEKSNELSPSQQKAS